jgi:hypothetical protein
MTTAAEKKLFDKIDDINENITEMKVDIAVLKSRGSIVKTAMSWGTVAKISAILTAGLTPVAIAVASVIQSAPAQ